MIDLHTAMAKGGHEETLFWQDAGSGLRAVVALHDTRLGPALGGVRLLSYGANSDAVSDALALSRAATYANALAGLDYGGGAAVIDAAPDRCDETLLRAFGRRLDALDGRFIALADTGLKAADVETIARETAFVAGASRTSGVAGAALTAKTVYLVLLATVQTALGEATLRNLTIAVQGAGNVGCRLIERLAADGAHIVVTDSDAEQARRAAGRFGARLVGVESIYDVECDVFSPNALGGVLNARTIPRLRCRVVCGGASNQLEVASDGALLGAREILHAPDFVANCGGAIAAAEELAARPDAARAEARTEQVFATALQIFAQATRRRITPIAAAEQIADERIAALTRLRRPFVPAHGRPH
jgi:leucine dehydrogenase